MFSLNFFLYCILLSETFVYDCTWIDKTTSATDFWDYWATGNSSTQSQSANTITVDDTGILIETDATQYSASQMQINIVGYSSNNNPFSAPVCFELDVISSDNCKVQVARKKSDNTVNYTGITQTGHIKIVITETKYEIYVDGTKTNQETGNYLGGRIYFQSSQSSGNGSIKYKNLKVYPI